MKKLITTKLFAAAFFLSYFSFFVLTIFILDIKRDGVGVGHLESGYPFTYYYSHCFGGTFIWLGLIGNCIFAATLSLVAGVGAAYLRSKFSSPEFRTKWYL